MEQKSNKTIVAGFYKRIVGQRESSLINQYVREDYIQHSPMGKDGREGLFEMVEFLKSLPPSTETQSPVKMLIAEGDMVAGLLDIKFMGKRMLVVDLFRLQDGLLAEHWDVVQEIDADLSIDHIIADENASDLLANKELITDLLGVNLRRLIGEGDVIVSQSEITEGDNVFAQYDVFRLKDGIIQSQLTVKQQVPDVMMHNNGMF
ncbi:hypothetical protein HK413_00385 [Mucilaginibacter sp. S1162]|uniref:SnoaL-like domain-containing protein n=1 Tax=Mucilaginibacter humi TaxID=2732510 RepID=A0ABX1W4P8_9SPHI|nr:nuclear transport factor 2 family protein [Mucilaginibacter humi]NNU33037.1 hypothetical protein [Mucilaginibacter humi]